MSRDIGGPRLATDDAARRPIDPVRRRVVDGAASRRARTPPDLTDALLFRRNVAPFRVSGGLYYSYAIPSAANGAKQYFGDIFQYRLAFEHFLDDSVGFGYAVEVVGIHGLPFRLDGHEVNAGRSTFGLLGVKPTVEYDFTDRIVGAAGVLFTAAGRDDVAAVYPTLSVYYYWNPRGKVVARLGPMPFGYGR